MNRIYFAVADDDFGGVYISAPTSREARKIAWCEELINNYADGYTDFEVRLCRVESGGKKGPKTTNLISGTLDIKEIISEGLAWWSCPQCEKHNFAVGDINEYYQCLDCGHTDLIPYIGL